MWTPATILWGCRTQIQRWFQALPLKPLRDSDWIKAWPLAAMSGGVTAIVLALQATGGLELLELQAFDRWVSTQPPEPPDDRLLVVGITEPDLQLYGWPLRDAILVDVLERLQRAKAKVIGIDLYRNLPQPPGTALLANRLQAQNVVGILQLGGSDQGGIGPSPALRSEQIGFNDLLLDTDSVVRRSLLFATDSGGVHQSFSFRLATDYLRDRGIQPKFLNASPDAVAWGKATLQPLTKNSGGYATLDDRGYQILMEYHAPGSIAPVVSLQDLRSGRVPNDRIRDRIVIVGTLAPSLKDLFFTPYSAQKQPQVLVTSNGLENLQQLEQSGGLPGVLIHAHLTHQLLGVALGEDSLFRFLPGSLEALWIAFWATIGVAILYDRNHPLLWLAAAGGEGVLWGIQWGLLSAKIWLPGVAPALAFPLGVASSLGYSRYHLWHLQQTLLRQTQEQTAAIAQLQALRQASPTLPVPPDSTHTYPTTTLPPEATEAPTADYLDYSGPTFGAERPTTASLTTSGFLGGRYMIQKVLGEGGFGITYLAKDNQRPGSPICVIKRFSPTRRDPRFLEAAYRLFQAEAHILETLGRQHDRIPQLLAYLQEDNEFYLVQDYIEGHPLNEELRDHEPFSAAATIDFLLDVLSTLQFIHRHNIIHRDLKPSNLIHRPDGTFVVIDFGAVKHLDGAERKTIGVGTPGYIPPEQVAGLPTLNSDLYALGMIAIQCLITIPPHMLDLNSETGDLNWQPLIIQYHGNSAEIQNLIQILQNLTQYNSCDRYQSAELALKDLKKLRKSFKKDTVM